MYVERHVGRDPTNNQLFKTALTCLLLPTDTLLRLTSTQQVFYDEIDSKAGHYGIKRTPFSTITSSMLEKEISHALTRRRCLISLSFLSSSAVFRGQHIYNHQLFAMFGVRDFQLYVKVAMRLPTSIRIKTERIQ